MFNWDEKYPVRDMTWQVRAAGVEYGNAEAVFQT